jgi:plasmid stabilization system protein ParE
MTSYGFHPEADEEYLAATQYYLERASELIAAAFVAEVETAIQTLRVAPTRWSVIEEPKIRRYLLTRFPYAIYYRYEANHERVSIYALMHTSRRPGYWRDRVD